MMVYHFNDLYKVINDDLNYGRQKIATIICLADYLFAFFSTGNDACKKIYGVSLSAIVLFT